MAVIFKLHEVG